MSSAPPPHDEDIIVFVADTGRRATLSASALRGAAGGKEDVVAVVAAALGLSAPDLIVLGLDGKAALENVSGGLMVFTKSVLSNESSSDITNSDINISMSPLPPIQTLVPLLYSTNESPSSLLDACYASFKSNVDYAKGVVASAEENARKMDELLEEQRVQSLALRIAVQSLQMHCKPACDAFDSFIAHTQKEIAKNFGLIQSFPSDLQALHRIPVHPKIASRKSSAAATANQDDDNNDGDSRFLSDYVPEEKLLLWADKCRLGHEEFVKKTMALSEVVKTLKSGSEMEASNGLDIDFETLTSQTSSAQSNLANLRQTLQLLIRDFTRVQSILQDLRNRDDHRPNNNSNYHQAQQIDQKTLTALHHLQEIHTKEYIPSLTTTATHISNLFTTLHTSKLHATSALRSRLRSISHLQTLLSNTIAPGMTRLNQNLTSMSQAFGQLLHVHRMPAAWGAAMVEIVRRREFVRVLVARAESVASGFARVGEIEKRRRETFDGEISKYLPRVVVGEKGNGLVVVQGLDEGVPKVEVRVVKGGDLLPRIGRTDVYEFEQFISQIRAAMTDVDPSSSTVPSTNQTLTSSHTSSAAGNPADSISKLQATMTKMIPQIDAVAGEFDRQLAKSGFGGGGAGGGGGDRVGKLEEENARLRAELNALKSGGGGSLARNQQASGGVGSPVPPATPSTSAPVSARKSIVAKAMSAGNFDGDWAKAEETIRAYESRIRTLEDLLQRSYHMEKSHMNNSAASLAPTDPVILQQLQNENSTLRTRLSVLESQFNTTSSSLQSYEVKLKEVRSDRENLRTLLDSERSSFQSRNAELEREISNLRNQVQEKDKEGRVVVGEVERCAGFVREVYELLDDCAGAFKVRGDSSSGGGGGVVDESPHPLAAHYYPSSTLQQQQASGVTRNSSTSSSLGKYQSPTSPSAGLMALVNAATSFGSSSAATPIGRANGGGFGANPLLLAHQAQQQQQQQQQQAAAAAPVLAILSTLRTDEREIRRRLRELQDDIRCQTLELVGLQDEMAAMGAMSSQNYSAADDGGGGGGGGGAGELSPEFGSSGLGVPGGSGGGGIDVGLSPNTENSRSGISIGGTGAGSGGGGVGMGRVGHSLATSIPILEELHISKREIQRLESVVEDLVSASEKAKAEADEVLFKYNELIQDLPLREAHIEQLTEAITRLNSEKEEWIESNENAWMKMERLKGVLETVQNEKLGLETRLRELSKELEGLQVEHGRLDSDWKLKMGEMTQTVDALTEQVKALKGSLQSAEDVAAMQRNESEAAQFDLNKTIVELQGVLNSMETRVQTAEAERSAADAIIRQKNGDLARLEDTCEKLQAAVGKEMGKAAKLKEKVEDWRVVCKLAMECLTTRFEALGNMGDALADMDMFVSGFVTETLDRQASPMSVAVVEGGKNPLHIKNADMNSFKSALTVSSSMSNSVGEQHDMSPTIDSRLPNLDVRESYLNMIYLIDSLDIAGWSDAVIKSCHTWKEGIMTQSLRRAMVPDIKISFSRFKEGDLALFLPTRNPKAWAAFNVNAPHYFLSTVSAETHFSTQIKNKDWILAVITKIEERQAVNNSLGSGTVQSEGNPFGLVVGSRYFWCTSIPLTKK